MFRFPFSIVAVGAQRRQATFLLFPVYQTDRDLKWRYV